MLVKGINRLREFKRSVGVVGLAWSGKTVFLTSLIDHLKNHEPEKLRLEARRRTWLGRRMFGQEHTVLIRRFEELPVRGPFQQFPYKRFRDTLAQERPQWPEKTRDVYEYACRFERSDQRRAVRLSFLDFPGERLADVSMGGSYEQWSDLILEEFDAQHGYRELAAEFLELQDGRDLAADTVTDAYRLTLARFVREYKPLISPSTFLLDSSGGQAQHKPAEQLAAERIAGIAADRQFAPLSKDARSNNAKLAEVFSAYYQEYRAAVPDKLLRRLARCHRLVVLIDVTGTLAAGVGRYNDTQAILESLLGLCRRKPSLLNKAGRLLASVILPEAWRPGGISRIAFVASKADMARYDQTDRLVGLLRRMVEKKVRDYDMRYDFFACSAVTSTRPAGTELAGHLTYDTEGNLVPPRGREDAVDTFYVSSPPEAWPDRWSEGDYTFPQVYPAMSPKKDQPPDQEGLGNILDFLMEEDYTE